MGSFRFLSVSPFLKFLIEDNGKKDCKKAKSVGINRLAR